MDKSKEGGASPSDDFHRDNMADFEEKEDFSIFGQPNAMESLPCQSPPKEKQIFEFTEDCQESQVQFEDSLNDMKSVDI